MRPGRGPSINGSCRSPSLPQWSPAVAAGSSDTHAAACRTSRASRNGARPLRPGRDATQIDAAQVGAAAAMEPGRCGRVESRRSTFRRCSPSSPQWSPAVAAGSSRLPLRLVRVIRHAAMEPGRCGRVEHQSTTFANGAVIEPQWSPAVAAGSSGGAAVLILDHVVPQWSPAVAAGSSTFPRPDYSIDITPQWSPAVAAGSSRTRRYRHRPAAGSRNGARPLGPGRVGVVPDPDGVLTPQWSPAVAAGSSS